ncbi:hypothetical protein HCN44_008884 [Aphidius gifuensis]|uniref:Uncharacterized protein n=1 Tax=Aphidius gifuensis TaxID=684658 RepID=A0A834XQF8_APHGI|nr:zinc finger protein 888-like [Aphidius gifuensis]XP_044013759.1 zinc finger protein 888-like [Aphidius gifuensis]KAF7991513.1 hypothetical protein HCN44_008884 [Aphidius gifuensis]
MFVVTKKINSQNIKKLCRTCLREDGEKMICLFVGPADSSLAAKLTTLSCLEIWQGDELPEKLCDRCVTRAESALLFREQCRAADRALRQAISKEGYNNEKNSDCNDTIVDKNNTLTKPFKCFDCNKVFLNYHELCTHRRLLHTLANSSFIQDQSSSSSSSSIEYNHMNIVETTNNFEYSTTDITCPTKNITSTTKYERPSCALYCSLCNHTFSNVNQLMNHKLSHSTISNNNDNLNKESNYQQSSLSVNNKKHKCPVCGKCFDKKSKLSTHEYLHTNDRPFKCINCPKKYTSKSKLNAHMRLHTKTNIYQCKICDKVFSYPSYLKEHVKIHNQIDKKSKINNNNKNINSIYKCSICDKVYKYKKNLIQHIKLHNDDDGGGGSTNFKLSCEICHKLFSQKYNLKIHMKIHSGIKNYECKYCFKKFVEKSNYNEHLRTHTKIKPFNCLICHKTFTQSSHLKNHQAIHNSSRPHKCKLCDKTFKLLSHLNRHTSTMHNTSSSIKSFKCLICNEFFTQAFSLKRHKKNKHIDDD